MTVNFLPIMSGCIALHFLARSGKFISYCTVNFIVNFLLLHVEFYIDCLFRIVSLFYFNACSCIACCMACSQSGTVCACWVASFLATGKLFCLVPVGLSSSSAIFIMPAARSASAFFLQCALTTVVGVYL